eukprot:138715_1
MSKKIIKDQYGKLYDESFVPNNLSIYTTLIEDAEVDQITDWGEMEITDELDLIDDDEIVIIVIDMHNDNDNDNIVNILPLKQMKTYLDMDNGAQSIKIKVRYWNKRNEINEIKTTFNRNITVEQFKKQISRVAGLPCRADSSPLIQVTPSHSCICKRIDNQPTENGKINFFYVPFGSVKGCTLAHVKLELDCNNTIEQLCKQINKTASVNVSNMRLFAGGKNITFIKKGKLSDLEFTENTSNIVYCCNDEKGHSHDMVVEVEKCELAFKNNGERSFENITTMKSPNLNKSRKIIITAKSSDSILFIKTLIQQKLKIPVEKQLVFHESLKNKVQHIGNDYTLRDIGLTEKISLLVVNWSNPIHLTFDLFNHSHQLFDKCSSKLFDIFNFNQTDDILFVSPRYIFHKDVYLQTYGKNTLRSYFGNINDGTMISALRLNASWMPFITQTRTGMSAFLCCLFVLYRSEVVTENKTKLLGHLRELSPKFSPFINSMQILLDGNVGQLTPAHKSALSNGCYKLFREIIPMSSVPNEKVFEYSHYIFWYLLRFVSDKFEKTEPFKEETLICPLSSSYLVNPVMIPNDDKIYSYQSIADRINGGKLFDINNKTFSDLKITDITVDYDTYLLLKAHSNCKTVCIWNWTDLTKSVRKEIDNFERKVDEKDDEKDNTGSNIQSKLALTWRQITKYIYDTTEEVCVDCQKKDDDEIVLSCAKCEKLNERKILSECMTMKPINDHEDYTSALVYDTNGNKCVITKLQVNANEGNVYDTQ